MGAVFDQLVKYLEKEEWPLDKSGASDGVVSSRYKGDNGVWRVVARVDKPPFVNADGHELFVFRSILDQNVPPNRLAAVQELVCRSNYSTAYGHIDFDVTDGELSFWTGNILNGKADLAPVFQDIVSTNVATMDQVYPAIMQVIFANASPQAVLDALDSDSQTPLAPPGQPGQLPPEPMCPKCARPLTFVPQYQRLYCYNCQQYV